MSHYYIYIDESGDPNIEVIDDQYPVFGVGAMLFEKDYFENQLMLQFSNLKIKHGFSSETIFHSSDIRKQRGDFVILTNYQKRVNLMEDISVFFKEMDTKIISSVIRKKALKENYSTPGCPYDLAFQFILERSQHFLKIHKATATIFIEERTENKKALQRVYKSIKENGNGFQSGKAFLEVFPEQELNFVKKENKGTQIVDLMIYPVTSSLIRKDKNKALDVLKEKFYGGRNGEVEKYGFKIFP